MRRRPSARSRAIPSAVEARSSLSSTSSAVGPSITFPKTVGAISTPFVVAVGTGSRMCETSGRLSLSKTISSPRRGVIVNPPSPAMRWTSSEYRPAALTTQRALSPPREVVIRHPAPARASPVTCSPRRRATPARTACVAHASGGVHGHTMNSSGTSSAPSAPGPRCGSRRWSSSAATVAIAVVAVARGVLADRGEARELLVVPGDEQGAGALDRDARPAARSRAAVRGRGRRGAPRWCPGLASKPVCRIAVFALLVPAPTSPRSISGDAQLEARELAGDRRADVAGADDRDVAVEAHAPSPKPISA